MSNRFLTIDEEGYFSVDGLRMADAEQGRTWLENLRIDQNFRPRVLIDGHDYYVEAFHRPLVANAVDSNLRARFPYGFEANIDPDSLCVDEWDQFHALTSTGVPLVLSRLAQTQLFESAAEYDDESITIGERRLKVIPLYSRGVTNIAYEYNQTHPLIDTLIPPLKMNRSRVLIIGNGSNRSFGFDASWWHKRGHIVTVVHSSSVALENARMQFGESQDLRWRVADPLKLPSDWTGSFDVIFEQSYFCSVAIEQRSEVIKLWWRLLSSRGRLIAFMPMTQTTEWEMRQRLLLPPARSVSRSARFQPLLWIRERESTPERLANELFLVVERGD